MISYKFKKDFKEVDNIIENITELGGIEPGTVLLLVVFGTIVLTCPIPKWEVKFKNLVIPGWIPANIALFIFSLAVFHLVASSGLNILYYLAVILTSAALVSGSQLKNWLKTLKAQEIQEG